MTDHYLDAVAENLRSLTRADRERAMTELAAQLQELTEAGIDPRVALGEPSVYARQLQEALASEAEPSQPQWRLGGVPVETRGFTQPQVRSRAWDPTNPHLLVPRLFGIGWTLNLGALAVRLGLIRPDDVDAEVLADIPPSNLRLAQAVPAIIAGGTTAGLALTWRSLPPRVASGFDIAGRTRGEGPRWILILAAALGAVPAAWAQRTDAPVEDRLVDAATATSLAVISASIVAATVAQARHPHQRWGLVIPAALPVAVASSLAVAVVPLRAGLRRAWRVATPRPAREQGQ